MPIILALETSTEVATVALLLEERVLSRQAVGVQTHSETVLPMVQDLLREAGIGLAACDAIAYGCGPGSFTGVRTACGVAQGLAFGAGLPVVPIVTLAAMAHACRKAVGADNVLAMLDARMGEVYCAQYRFDGQWRSVQAPFLAAPESVAVEGNVALCGNAVDIYRGRLSTTVQALPAYSGCMPDASLIAELAHIAFVRGEFVHARDAQPLYLRNKVALTTAERSVKVRA